MTDDGTRPFSRRELTSWDERWADDDLGERTHVAPAGLPSRPDGPSSRSTELPPRPAGSPSRPAGPPSRSADPPSRSTEPPPARPDATEDPADRTPGTGDGGGGGLPAAAPPATGRRERGWQGASAIVALLLALALGSRYVVGADITIGMLLAVPLAPVWLTAVARYRWARAFLVLGALCAVTAPVLTEAARLDHVVDPLLEREAYVRLAELVIGVGALLWARLHLGIRWLAVAYGTGMLVDALLREEISFKFGVGLAVAVVVLGWLTPGLRPGRGRWRHVPRTVQALACAGLGVLFALDDGRSAFALLLLTAAVVMWQVRMGDTSLRRSAAITVGSVVAAGLAVYGAARALILDGAFGTAMAQRTAQQIELSGNLLAAGRPEMGATTALVAHRPWGFGPGVSVNGADLSVAKHGMSRLGYDPENNYVYQYMFGQGIELHSLFGDLWAVYGPAGVLLWVFLLLLVAVSLVRRTVRASADALLVYAAILTAWNLLFSPIYASVPMLVLAVALLLPRHSDARPTAGPPEPAVRR